MGGKNSGRVGSRKQTFDTGVEPWERHSFDTDKSFEAFRVYRNMGHDRTMEKASLELGKTAAYRRTMEAWSSENGWRIRVAAYDNHEDRVQIEAALKIAAKKAKQKLGFAEGMWVTAARALGMWNDFLQHFSAEQAQRKEEGKPLMVPPITPGEVQRLAESGIKLSQLLEGKPTEIGETRHQITVDDRRKEMQRIIADKRVRNAMRVVSKAVEESGDGTVH